MITSVRAENIPVRIDAVKADDDMVRIDAVMTFRNGDSYDQISAGHI